MKLKTRVRKALERATGYSILKIPKVDALVYDFDGLRSIHCHDFMTEPAFNQAYARGVKAIGGFDEYRWFWRVHIALWVAASAARLPGDFVECGTNRGFMSSAIMQHLDWARLGKTFYLLDTFSGLDRRFVSETEITEGAFAKNQASLDSGFYVSGAESVVANFAQWKNIRIVQGAIPETLEQLGATQVSYLHLDMNCALPEIAALEFFWNRMVTGGWVLMDDYAYQGFHVQKEGLDDFAEKQGVGICTLPTGQGLLVRPPAA